MHMEMPMAGFGPMSVRLACKHHGDRNQASMTNPALGDDVIGQIPHILCLAPQYSHFQAALVIEMDMQGCHDRNDRLSRFDSPRVSWSRT